MALVAVRYGGKAGEFGRTGVFAGGAHRFHLRHYWGRTGLYRWYWRFNGILRRFRAMSIGRKARG